MISSRTERISLDITTTWIVAQNLTTSSVLWTVQLPVSFSDSWHSQVVGIHGGQVYASRASNGLNPEYLYALDAQNGGIIWRSEELVDQASNAQSVVFAANGDVIHGNFRSLLRIRRSDGRTVWSTPRLCPTSNGCGAAVAGNRVYAWEDVDTPSGLQLTITASDVDTGTKLYSSAPLLQGFFTINQITPLVGPGGIVYAPLAANTPGDAFIALRDTGFALPEIWRIPMGYTPFASFGVGPDGSVYTYSRNNGAPPTRPRYRGCAQHVDTDSP